MSQCVPSWDNPTPPSKRSGRTTFAADVPTLDCEVAELTWENGQIALHSLGPPRVPTKFSWDKPRAGGTLESIVNQATLLPHRKPDVDCTNSGIYGANEIVPWFDHHHSAASAATASMSATTTMDALVPCSNNNNNNRNEEPSSHAMESRVGTCGMDGSTRVGSCSAKDGGRVARGGHEWSSCREQSVSGSATFGRDSSRQVTLDTCEVEFGVGAFTSTSMGSPGTSSGKQCTKSITGDENDSVCHSKPQREACDEGDHKKAKGKYLVSTKRSRAAAIHNQSERKRRDKINQRMKTLQKLVPNSNKTDKASMLDEVIEYLKQLQAQIHMMSRMNMSPAAMMLPMALQQQQQLQMSMMAPMMGMGMGMGHNVMDLNSMTRPGLPPVLHPSVAAAFMPMAAAASWDAGSSVDRLPASAPVLPDPLSTFLACQSQPMTMDAYSRMAALYQQMHQAPGPTTPNKN